MRGGVALIALWILRSPTCLIHFFLISGGMLMVKRQLLKMGSLWTVWVSTFVSCLMLSSEKEVRHWRR